MLLTKRGTCVDDCTYWITWTACVRTNWWSQWKNGYGGLTYLVKSRNIYAVLHLCLSGLTSFWVLNLHQKGRQGKTTHVPYAKIFGVFIHKSVILSFPHFCFILSQPCITQSRCVSFLAKRFLLKRILMHGMSQKRKKLQKMFHYYFKCSFQKASRVLALREFEVKY